MYAAPSKSTLSKRQPQCRRHSARATKVKLMKIWAKTKEFPREIPRSQARRYRAPLAAFRARCSRPGLAYRSRLRGCVRRHAWFRCRLYRKHRELQTTLMPTRTAEGLRRPLCRPHRHDDPATLAIMRGEDGPITVRHERFQHAKGLCGAADPVAVGRRLTDTLLKRDRIA